MRIRDFDPHLDLRDVLDLVGRGRARRDAGEIFHPGGLQWWLRRVGRPRFSVGVMTDGTRLAGFALRDGGDVLVQTDAAHLKERVALLAWAEDRARSDREPELLLSIWEDDPGLHEDSRVRGYAPSERYGYELVRELPRDPGPPSLPPGFEMISLTPELNAAYVALHRAEWSRPGKPSTYDEQQHESVVAMPDFRYDLVSIVRAPDGSLAASCISWWDPRSSSVEIEPLGTHPSYRRRGLARAIVQDVFRRAWTLGATYVLVWGTTANTEAKALYESAGMRTRRVLRDHRLVLEG
jgi:GNAT superfamily N-acetyltransferase